MKHQVLLSLKNNEKIFMNVVCCSRHWRFKGYGSLHDCVVQTEVEGAYWFGPVRESVCLSIYASYKEADMYMLRIFAIHTLLCFLKENRP